MQRKFKTGILTRYINSKADLFKLTDNKTEWFNNCGASLIESTGSKIEKLIQSDFIEEFLNGSLSNKDMLD